MLVGLFFNEVMFLGGIIFWAMPLVLLRQLVFVAFFLIDTFSRWNYFLGDAFGPGCFGLAAARLPLANQALRIPIAIFVLGVN